MADNFQNNPQNSQWLTDATNTATIPVTGELFTSSHVARIADEVTAIQYALGLPGLRGSNSGAWGTHETVTTAVATSSLTSVVFAADISSVLTSGMILAGAAPTTTGWRKITAVSTFTVTVNAAFDSNLAAEYAVRHGTITRRIAAIEAVSTAARYTRGHISGLTLSNNVADATNDIDIAAGSARDSTDAVNIDLAAAITKRLDAAWAVGSGNGGLDTGSIANTTYHVWLIKRSDTGVVDALFSASASAPTMPANYDYKRRIGSRKRVAGAWQLFTQDGDEVLLLSPAEDVSAATIDTTATNYVMSVPAGIIVTAIVSCIVDTGIGQVRVYSPDQSDVVVTGANCSFRGDVNNDYQGGAKMHVRTNTSAEIRARASASMTQFTANLDGWLDRRDR